MTNAQFSLPPPVRKPAILLGLAIMTALSFAPVRNHDFVNYDDQIYVYENPLVLEGLSWEGVRGAFTEFNAANWHPLTLLSHMIDIELFGVNPGAHHVVNLLFHIANTLLLFHVLQYGAGALWRSALTAALFAVHPMHVESVAWVAERKDVLSALFFLAAIWAHMRWTRNPRPAGFARIVLYAALAMLSKPMAVTLPFVLLLVDYWPLERIGPIRTRSGSLPSRKPIWGAVLEKAPLFALSAGTAAVTFFAQRDHGAMAPFSLAERLANAVVAYSAYVVKLLIPVNLAVFYPHPGMPAPGRLIAAALACAALSVVAIRAARTCRWGLMGWLWFIGMLVPVIGVVQVGSQAMADRYSYLPAIGIFVIVAWAAGAAARNARARPAIIAASVCVIAAAALGARRQVGYWQNSRTLMRRAAAVTECNFLAYNNIGVTFFDERRYDSALTYFHRALRCDSTFSPALYNTGITLARTRRYADALDWFHKTIRFDSTHAQAYHSIGETHDALGRDSLARVWYERALMIQSDLWEAHNSLAVWFQHHGEPDSAVIHFRAAIALRPGNAAAHHGLALSLWKRGDVGGAEYHFAQALSLDSTSWRACNNFGLFLVDLNRRRAALAAFDNAAALAPDSARPYVNRAMLHAALGDTGRAVADYVRALRIDSTLPIARERLNRIRAAKSSHLAGRHDNEQ